MKRIALLLALTLCLSLPGCPADEPTETKADQAPITANSETLDVHIKAGKIQPGMTAKDVLVEVTINHQPIPCRVELTALTETGYYTMGEDEEVKEDFLIRLDVFYSLPKGYSVDDINDVMECDGGEYDGTGSIGYDDNGCVEAWSHAIYGEETDVTPPAQEDPQPPQQDPVQDTPPVTQAHVHSWTEQPGSYLISCTTPSTKTYTCTCGQTKTETVPATGHDLKETSNVKPTCTKEGSRSTTCKRCGAAFLETVPATGHNWSAWQYENGRLHKRTCITCGAEETQNHQIPSGSVTCSGCGADIIN